MTALKARSPTPGHSDAADTPESSIMLPGAMGVTSPSSSRTATAQQTSVLDTLSTMSTLDILGDELDDKTHELLPTATKRSNKKMAAGQSLNHLLNFTLPPRQTNVLSSLPRRSRKATQGYGVWNKEKFVNAQYRFVMKPTGDYTVHFADPDIFFQWQDILQVIIPRTSALATASGRQDEQAGSQEGHTTCPICLSPPSAPRMTKCGHVFCYPCVLHYLSTSDHAKWNRCPICFDSINEKQLKSVKWFDEDVSVSNVYDIPHEASSSSSQPDTTGFLGESPQPGSMLHMRLMERPQITTLALPRSRTWPSDALPPHQAPFHFLPDVFRFARFMLATPEYLLADLSRDLDELEAERMNLRGMNDELSVTFVDLAEEKVRRQMEKASALESAALRDAVLKAEQEIRNLDRGYEQREKKKAEKEQIERDVETRQEQQSLDDIPEAFLATQHSPQPNIAKPSQSARNQRPRRNLNPPPPSTSTYFFYQAASGAPIFLHPLDIRILLAHFHSYAAFPNEIAVRVEASAEGSVNDELRRRCKYLGHVPESADVVFVEADLRSVVGAEGLRAFEAPLRMRRSKRKEKSKKDDRARAKAEEKEREKLRLPLVPPSSFDYVYSPIMDRPSSPDYILPPETTPTPPPTTVPTAAQTQPQAQSQPAGAWGQRSFASALHSAPSAGRTRPGQLSRAQRETLEEDEWDMDAAWHELEAARGGARVGGGAGGGTRRKRSNKLVVLGGAGGRRR